MTNNELRSRGFGCKFGSNKVAVAWSNLWRLSVFSVEVSCELLYEARLPSTQL